MEPQTQKSSSKIWIVAVIIILAIVGAVYAFTGKKATPSQTVEETPVTTTTETPVDTKKTVYKSGTYTAEGNYVSPGGAESINVTLTLTNDVITDATVTSNAFRPISMKMQGQFISGFKQLVIGKNIDEVQLDKVAGSSLTPKGFNDALLEIKTQAKA